MDPLTAACTYLWNKQAADGGWHSETHTIMKGGAALTPFVLNALMAVPDSVYPKSKKKIEAALGFTRNNANDEGVLGLTDPDILEYPNYSTAYGLLALAKYGNSDDVELIDKITSYLVDQQFDEDRGIFPNHPAYGGWGFGETHLDSGYTGHIDLSHTRRVLQALQAAGYKDSTTKAKAHTFLSILQKHPQDNRLHPGTDSTDKRRVPYDGGFYFSPVVLVANKGDQEPESNDFQKHYRSYATATCDGLLSLLALGFNEQSEPIQAAVQWLQDHPKLSKPGGIPAGEADSWDEVMVFYHLMVRAEVNDVLNIHGWENEMTMILKDEQAEDGSFSNPYGGPNKEDDPILATTMAVISLNVINKKGSQ